MSNNIRVIQYISQPELKTSERKKRESNAFFLFRNSMKETAPKNFKMTELSKIASDSWKNLPEEEKTKWKKLYEIKRDLPDQNSSLQNTNDKVDQSLAQNFQTFATNLIYGQAAENSIIFHFDDPCMTLSSQHFNHNYSNPDARLPQTIQHNMTVNMPIVQA